MTLTSHSSHFLHQFYESLNPSHMQQAYHVEGGNALARSKWPAAPGHPQAWARILAGLVLILCFEMGKHYESFRFCHHLKTHSLNRWIY